MDTDGKVIMITGATDGLGKQVAEDLARQGADVLLHGRNPEKGAAVVAELGVSDASYYNADFADLEAVRMLADEVLADHGRIDVLINNAGIGFGAPGTGREVSRDGFELRFQVNYLAGFLLTLKLLPVMRAEGRIVMVASGAQQAIDFDDVMLEQRYSGNRAYSQSKLAQIMFAFELARTAEGGPSVTALHPATYMDTNMVREAEIAPTNSVQTGANAVEYLATSDDVEGDSGAYYNRKSSARADAQAYDEHARRRLWALSEELVGI